jgi:hypothetical protein
MIDYNMYRRFYPDREIFADMTDGLEEGVFDSSEPPEGDFLALLPASVHAFDLSRKTWRKFTQSQFN